LDEKEGTAIMPASGESVKPSPREILADSHIAAICIAVLFLWSLEAGLRALSSPFWRAVDFVFEAAAILDIPYISRSLTFADRLMLIGTFTNLFFALSYLAAAWLLSRWVYGLGPLRSLSKLHTGLARRDHV
jgi:hypothetical protein